MEAVKTTDRCALGNLKRESTKDQGNVPWEFLYESIKTSGLGTEKTDSAKIKYLGRDAIVNFTKAALSFGTMIGVPYLLYERQQAMATHSDGVVGWLAVGAFVAAGAVTWIKSQYEWNGLEKEMSLSEHVFEALLYPIDQAERGVRGLYGNISDLFTIGRKRKEWAMEQSNWKKY